MKLPAVFPLGGVGGAPGERSAPPAHTAASPCPPARTWRPLALPSRDPSGFPGGNSQNSPMPRSRQLRRLSGGLPNGDVLTADRKRPLPPSPHRLTPQALWAAVEPLTPGAQQPPRNPAALPEPGGCPQPRSHLLHPSNTSGQAGLQKQAGKDPASSIKPERKDICKIVTTAVCHKIFMLKYKVYDCYF